jgi:N6-L-threonylcarbamoyladenine synthase
MKILAIETSCDETGIALIDARGGVRSPKFSVMENLISSQISIHRPFGGVVPNLAKREHLKNLPLLFEKMMAKHSRNGKLPADLIAVTVGPGLEPALWTGIGFAKMLAKKYGKQLVGANHLEGHLYSFLLPRRKRVLDPVFQRGDREDIFPAVVLIVSGGHTILLRMDSFSKWRRLGETRDDAAGEAFDKVARLLDLPYPGGPEIEKSARGGDPQAIPLPRPMLREKDYDFSFSGLKTAVLYYARGLASPVVLKQATPDIAASFEQAVSDVLIAKTIRAAESSDARSIILCGGVAANRFLQKNMRRAAKRAGCRFFVPDAAYHGDNAAMIGAAGYFAHLRKKKYPLRANGTLDI